MHYALRHPLSFVWRTSKRHVFIEDNRKIHLARRFQAAGAHCKESTRVLKYRGGFCLRVGHRLVFVMAHGIRRDPWSWELTKRGRARMGRDAVGCA